MRLKLYRGYWHAVWSEGGRTRRASLRTQDRGAAEQKLADLLKTPQGETIAEIMAAYLDEKDHTAIAPERLRDAWKALGPFFGHLRPDQVDRPLCRAYMAVRRGAWRKDGTISRELRTLRAGLRWADRNTPAVFDMPAMAPPRDRHLDRTEYRRLVEASRQSPHISLFIVLALATAGRATALLELTWDRVDWNRGIIKLGTGKQGKTRATVPMTQAARDALEKAHEAAVSLYVIEYAGRPVKSVKMAFGRACKRAGLEDVTPHDLRRTAAVWMAEAGIPMSEIAAYLGHSDSRITEKHYAQYSPEYLRKAAGALEV